MARRPRRRGTQLGALARAEYVAGLEQMADFYGELCPSFAEQAAQIKAGAAFEASGWAIKCSVPAVDMEERYLISSDNSISLVNRGAPGDV